MKNSFTKWLVVVVLGLVPSTNLDAISNEILAGDGTAGYSGDGGSAVSAKVSNPYAVARDSIGNLYIVDVGNNAIRQVNTSGVISTLISGLNNPQGICVDSDDNLYVADQDNWRVGMYTTTTHTYNASFISGICAQTIGIDRNNKLYIGANFPAHIDKYNSDGSIDVANLVTSAMGMVNPKAISIDSLGNVYVAEPNLGAIAMYNASTSTYNTNFISGLSDPYGVYVDSLNNIYIANTGAGSILVRQNGAASPGTLVTGLNSPRGLFVDEDMNLYMAESGANWVRKFFFPSVAVSFTTGAHFSGPVMGGIKFVGSDDDDVCIFDGSPTQSLVTVTTDLSAETAGGINVNHGEFHVNNGKTPVAPLKITNGVDLRLTSGQVSSSLTVDTGGVVAVDAGKKVGDALVETTTYSFIPVDGYFESGSTQIAWPINLKSYVPYAETDGNPNWLTDDTEDQGLSYGGVHLNYSGGAHIQNGEWVDGSVYWVGFGEITGAHPTISAPTDNDVALVGAVGMQGGSSINLGAGATWARNITVFPATA
ncbi:MAG: hypothetical protein LW696_06915 [Alphaproteobacteria bacterium]|nr:hypothetical protein [Alphaproteobacteria bacterium]